MNKVISLLVLISLTVANLSVAAAESYDVVKDKNNNVIKNTFENCVRTKWTSKTDLCGTPPIPKEVNVVEPEVHIKKPIKRSRSYLVFFDFNKYSLTPSAKEIIGKVNSEAYKNSPEVAFSITGHTDSSGSDNYNMKLSQRRAASVKTELVRLGADTNSIETFAVGETEPLVPTKDNVKEPQNRRVEIIYSVEE